MEEEETMSFPEESACSSSDHLQLYTNTVSEEWTGHFVLPNSTDISKLPCYLIGFDDNVYVRWLYLSTLEQTLPNNASQCFFLLSTYPKGRQTMLTNLQCLSKR